MPKNVDPALKERALRMMAEHRADYSSITAVSQAVADQLGIGKETVRRWVVQADIDAGNRPGVTSEKSAEIRRLQVENRRLREDTRSCARLPSSSRGVRPPQPLIVAFIEDMRSEATRTKSRPDWAAQLS